MSMNEALAEYFGKQAGDNDDQAQWAELYVKTAAENGVDLNKLSEAEVEQDFFAWQTAVSEKMAAETCSDEEKAEKEKLERAKKEHEEKKAELSEEAAKVAEADGMGRQMAHSFWDEVQKLASAREIAAEAIGAAKEPNKHISAIKNFAGKAWGAGAREAAKDVAEAKKEHSYLRGHGLPMPKVDSSKAEAAAKETSKARKQLAAGVGGAAAAAGGAAGAHHLLKKKDGSKEASAFEDVAAQLAVAKVAEAGYDADQAAFRIAALYEFGAQPELDKVAAIDDSEVALEFRALELVEAAGYPVTWNQ